MNEFENNAYFWQKIDTLYFSSVYEVTRPKGTRHPEYANLVYPVDYGRLKDTNAIDNEGISIYKGTLKATSVSSIIVCADILKKDLETKLLVGCSEEETNAVLEFLNQTDFQKTVIIRRGHAIPSWSISE